MSLAARDDAVEHPELYEADIEALLGSTPQDKIRALEGLVKLMRYRTASGESTPESLDSLVKLALPPETMEARVHMKAAEAIGEISSILLADLNNDFFQLQSKRALELLGERDPGAGRLSALFVLTQLAHQTPDDFDEIILQSSDVVSFCDNMFEAIFDSKSEVREAGIELLKEVIDVSLRRDSHTRDSLYHAIFKNINAGLHRSREESVHGALLALLAAASAQIMIGDIHLVVKTYDEALLYLDRSSALQHEAVRLVPVLAASVRPLLKRDMDVNALPAAHRRVSSGVIRQRIRSVVSEEQMVENLWGRLQSSVALVVKVMAKERDHPVALQALGDLALVLGKGIKPHLSAILDRIRSIYSASKRAKPAMLDAANECLGRLVVALGEALAPSIEPMLATIFEDNLRDSVFTALQDIVDHIPSLVHRVNPLVLRKIRVSLRELVTSPESFQQSAAVSTQDADALLVILRQLGKFRFGPGDQSPRYELLLTFGRDFLLPMLDTPNDTLRTAVCLACARLLVTEDPERGAASAADTKRSSAAELRLLRLSTAPKRKDRTQKQLSAVLLPTHAHQPVHKRGEKSVLCRALIFEVLSPLLRVVMADNDRRIRIRVLRQLNHHSLDEDMCEGEMLDALASLMHDEWLLIRMEAISILGRLVAHRPGRVVEELRQRLLTVLVEIQSLIASREAAANAEAAHPRSVMGRSTAANTGDRQIKDAIYLLRHVSRASQVVARAHTRAIWGVLEPLARMRLFSPAVRSYTLDVLGELALACGDNDAFDIDCVVELFHTVMREQTISSRRRAAVLSLGNLIQGTAYPAGMQRHAPALFHTMGDLLKVEQARDFRMAVLRTMGILGSIDPIVVEKHIKALAAGSGSGSGGGASNVVVNSTCSSAQQLASSLLFTELDLHAKKGTDHFCIASAINALVRVALDPALVRLHQYVMRAFMVMLKFLGDLAVDYLPQLVRSSIYMLSTTQDTANATASVDLYMQGLGQIAAVAGTSIRPFLAELMTIVDVYWTSSEHVLFLLDKILTGADAIDISAHMPLVFAKIETTIDADRKAKKYSNTLKLLTTIARARAKFAHHPRLILSVVARLVYDTSFPESARVTIGQRALECLMYIAIDLPLRNEAPILIHRLVRALRVQSLQKDALLLISLLITEMGSEFTTLGYLSCVQSTVVQMHIQSDDYNRTLQALNSDNCFPDMKKEIKVTLSERVIAQTVEPKGKDESKAPRSLYASLDQETIRAAWEISPKASSQDWQDWLRRVTRVLIRNAHSTAIRACSKVAELHPPTAKELFHVAFISSWPALYGDIQDDLIRPFQQAMVSVDYTPREIQQVVLELAELADFIDQGRLPLSPHDLAELAIKNRSFAKALRYKEHEFYLLTTGGILEAWSVILEQEKLHAQSPMEEREMEKTKHTEVLNYYNVRLPSDDDKKRRVTDDMNNAQYLKFDPAEKLAACVAHLISINHNLLQSDAASGVVRHVRIAHDSLPLRIGMAGFYSPQQRFAWQEALDGNLSATSNTDERTACLNRMECYHALGEWKALAAELDGPWRPSASETLDGSVLLQVAKRRCSACIGLNDWPAFTRAADALEGEDYESLCYKAMAAVYAERSEEARALIAHCRSQLDLSLTRMLSESYDRAYHKILSLQQLVELEEVSCYRGAIARQDTAMQNTIQTLWQNRLSMIREETRVWQDVLNTRLMVVSMDVCPKTMLRFAEIANEQGRHHVAASVLRRQLKGKDFLEADFDFTTTEPNFAFACLKHLWMTGQRTEALKKLVELTEWMAVRGDSDLVANVFFTHGQWSEAIETQNFFGQLKSTGGAAIKDHHKARRFSEQFKDIGKLYHRAADMQPQWAQAWHAYAMVNFKALNEIQRLSQSDPVEAEQLPPKLTLHHAISAVRGFFRSISLHPGSADLLQDALRLLGVWFSHGGDPMVRAVVSEGRASVDIDIWVDLIPQMIARIDHFNDDIRRDTQNWLIEIGKRHPHALVTPLNVALKSSPARAQIAKNVLEQLRAHHPQVISDATLVGHELIRVSALWHELWYTALTDASRLYFEQGDEHAMVNRLMQAHAHTARPLTPREAAFRHSLGHKLDQALRFLERFRQTGNECDLHGAWGLYYEAYRRITKMTSRLRSIDLASAAPLLTRRQNFDMVVPGMYQVKPVEPVPTVAKFLPSVVVIPSKQRPRKIRLIDSTGTTQQYLLKGQEDPRMDERVMTFLGLVNTLLAGDPSTRSDYLFIRRYSITPLSPDTGLIGWLHNCDTFFELIRGYRQQNKISLMAEHHYIRKHVPETVDKHGRRTDEGYERLPARIRKRILINACKETRGDDLANVLVSKSPDSETWVRRRTAFMRSLAVMSVTGYVLGLGDRHLSNIMLDRTTGEIIHIDFGDCFEAAQERDKYPERVPFRLTRMLRRAMEVGGISGTYRTTCEKTMHVLRDHKDSLLAVLEAFVYDPLLSWKLVQPGEEVEMEFDMDGTSRYERSVQSLSDHLKKHHHHHHHHHKQHGGVTAALSRQLSREPSGRGQALRQRRRIPSTLLTSTSMEDLETAAVVAEDVMNEKALAILERVELKLTGNDFSSALTPSVDEHEAAFKDRNGMVEGEWKLSRKGVLIRPGATPDSFPRGVSVSEQVEFLIREASDPYNLCQAFFGWYPFW
ncbi:hypothetical protein PTSG_11127 [Salpingoeca rosetta]|uniref:Serine/threonine-protein kinase TOR n=1 Tax=Salpingoeca rosetta (strain ATCC 50818 / BSB-021) TaxID=946362 RepID=F2US79_SALR5|nr:uncharacterized protein PTSG_11127 [Salpingoeca rosetta]EGD80484.1 hypothetical protein PTSG_11127 [Salpingoeca rosetta]|eukprot:XP_004988048.1 hypothetical protein PTSG_11127 [Salpingoeca rosetta]